VSAVKFTTADTHDHQHKIIGNFSITRAIIPDTGTYEVLSLTISEVQKKIY
jgi:hypothetical protein